MCRIFVSNTRRNASKQGAVDAPAKVDYTWAGSQDFPAAKKEDGQMKGNMFG